MISEVKLAVVRISTPTGTGSGFIFDEQGWVLTNAHVVGSYEEVVVTLGDRFEVTGEVVGLEEDVDLAIVKIQAGRELPFLSFGDSDDISAGDDVAAVGYPMGTLLGSDITVTKGIVSSLRRYGTGDYLQTDAAINPGNSGGPLVNARGEVVGINTSRIVEVSGSPIQGIGLSISSNTARELVPFLRAGGVVRASLSPTPTSIARIIATPTPQPRVYTNEEHWYSLQVPEDWAVESSDPDLVTLSEPATGSTIFVRAVEIDVDVYPTLDAYATAFRPSPASGWSDWGWSDWEVSSDRHIPYGPTKEAHEFLINFEDENGVDWRGRILWYLLGEHHVAVTAITTQEVWENDRDTLNRMLDVQKSFETAQYTSREYDYSVSHPPDWVEGSTESYDFWAFDPLGQRQILVEIRPSSSWWGFADVFAYGEAVDLSFADVTSRKLVYESRPNPSYRIDYRYTIPNTESLRRGALLITFGGGRAIWVYVSTEEDDWLFGSKRLRRVVEDIFLRVVVAP